MCLVTQSCLTLWDPLDCSPPGSSVHGILQARILEWVAVPPPGDRPNPGIEPRSPALQADSLPSEPTLLLSLISHLHDLMDDLSQATYVLCTQKIMLCFGIIPNKDSLKVFKLSNFLASPFSLKVYLNIESLILHDQKIITSL